MTQNPCLPTVAQMLEAAPMLQWRKCYECKHIQLAVDNIDPWCRCKSCGSMDTRQLTEHSKLLQAMKFEED